MPQFRVDFDILTGHTPGTRATLTSDVLQPMGWRSIGAKNTAGDLVGGLFRNSTGVTLKAIHLKTLKQGYTFDIDAASGGKLFDTIWLKNDNTDAYFLDANIPDYNANPSAGRFWMLVPPNTSAEIDDCDSGQECPFLGQAYAQNPADPVGAEWTRIKWVHQGLNPRFLALRNATPSASREIDLYGESDDNSIIAFVSDGQLFVYNHNTNTVSELTRQETILMAANRITIEKGVVNLWENGKKLREFGHTKFHPLY